MAFIENPAQIETVSYQLIDAALGTRSWSEAEGAVIRRMIHATADLEYAEITELSPGAAEAGIKALLQGCTVVTDTRMAQAGINQALLNRMKAKTACYMDDPEVAGQAQAQGITRAMVSMRRAVADPKAQIFAIGNAPTALFELARLIETGAARPALVIGVPVGFVGAAESKEAIAAAGVPCVITRGKKGGSPIAAAAVNALMRLAVLQLEEEHA
ncbi:MAG: precorrin-8X methylmutase [Solirubrobacterales bacterium]